MIQLTRILVPTDFSEPSQVALRYGKELANNFQASLHLLHVIEQVHVYGWMPPESFLPPLPEVTQEIERSFRKQLEATLTSDERERLKAQFVVLQGSPFLEIVRYAKSQEIDLIVMGTHGRGPIAHMLLGSVAEKVVRKAPCPVLTVRHPEHEFIMP